MPYVIGAASTGVIGVDTDFAGKWAGWPAPTGR